MQPGNDLRVLRHPNRQVDSERQTRRPGMTIFASGGLKDGLDIAKCLALT